MRCANRHGETNRYRRRGTELGAGVLFSLGHASVNLARFLQSESAPPIRRDLHANQRRRA